MNCNYVREHYGVPAEIGRRVLAHGEPGIVAEDRGNYIGVTLDKDKPGTVNNYHPTDDIVYLDMGRVRKVPKGRLRYLRYREYGDRFVSFLEYCKWDADPSRSWNTP